MGDDESHLLDALKYGLGRPLPTDPELLDQLQKMGAIQDYAARVINGVGAVGPMIVNPPLSEIKDAELIMEMIKRGYACMKLPADGGPPEALR